MSLPSVRLRPALITDVATALDWAHEEGWNPGLGDANAFMAGDPGGFVAAEAADGLVGTVSAVRYDDRFAFCGLFLARADRRHLGIGHELVEAALELVGDRVAGLDGVVAQQRNYRSMGFTLEHRSIRYSGVVATSDRDAPGMVPSGVLPIGPAHLEPIIAADRRWFPAPRRAFLEAWLDGRDGRSGFVAHDGADVSGYTVVRRCRTGWKIGPLFARDDAVATRLFLAALGCVDGEPLAIDVPEPNGSAVRLAKSFGLTPVFETARMYKGPAPTLPLGEIYGITSFELG